MTSNEFLENCRKHAFPWGRGGSVSIALGTLSEGRIALTVGDAGKGATAEDTRT
jgi:two-component sensor histidine kinase